MELDCDLSTINSEELLRKMWQQSEDVNRKKEIRSHLYKLRETRLRDLYRNGEDPFIMSGTSATGFGKDPLLPSHGDSLPDQSFQSLKTKEVRDSGSPTHDIKFHSLALNQPSTTGWDVRSSSEVTPDGRAYRSETVATTDGLEKINGGTAEFKGRNEQRSSASHQGDDKNFTKKASESTNTHLQEKVVIGDENSGRTEMKMSSTSTSSSSQVISSSSTVDNVEPLTGSHPSRYITDNTNRQYEHNQQQQQRLQEEQFRNEQQRLRQQHEEQRHVSTQQQQHQKSENYTEEYNKNRQESSRNVETEKHFEENKRYVDMDKASPEYQRQVQHLMAQPGEIISNTVEYPKPNVKMITTVKRLPDGTIVKNKRYETEELRPSTENVQQRSTTSSTNTSNQRSSQRRVEEDNLQTRLRNSREKNTTQFDRQVSPQRPYADDVDNVQYTQNRPQQLVQAHPGHAEELTSSTFSTVKKSSRRFSTETTSETVEEYDDRTPTHHGHGKPQDFSTHGFPSVRPNKLTQQYASERPRAAQPTDDFSTQGFPSVKPHKPTQQYPTDRPSQLIEREVTGLTTATPNSQTVRTIKTPDGDVIVVSKETQRSVKQKTNSERITETEIVSDNSSPQIVHSSTQHHKSEDFSTHGFPSVKESSPVWDDKPRHGTPTREQPRQPHAREDFSTHGFPSVKETSPVWDDMPRHGTSTQTDEKVITVSSQKKLTSSHDANTERVIEVVTDADYPQHERITQRTTEDFSTHGFPSVKNAARTRDISPQHYTTVRERERPISPRRTHEDYSTHGFPSARSPTRTKPGTSNHGYPAARSPTRSTQGFPSARDGSKPKPRTSQSPQRKVVTSTTATPKKPTTTATTTTVRKQKEVDATHRAFAASLRSSSPVDHNRRDSQTDHHHHQRLTPRSSVSSTTTTTTRTHRRDGREGSHDSTAPSETSRISSSTVTRQSPAKSVGKTVVTSKQTVVKARNVNGSNDTIDLTPQRSSTKSPSPGKTVTTTKTTTTTTTQQGNKTPISTTKITTTKSPTTEVPKTDNQLTKPTAEIETLINHEPLTITKTDFSSNDASFPRNEAIIEEPICKKKHFYQLGPSDDIVANTTTPLPTTTTKPTTTNETRITAENEHEQSSVPSVVDSKQLTAEEADILTKIFDSANGEVALPQKPEPEPESKPEPKSEPTTEPTETVEKKQHTETTKSPTYSPTAPSSHKTHRTSEHHVIKKDSPEREYETIQHFETDVINEPSTPLLNVSDERNPKIKYHPKENVNSVEQQRRTVLRETTFENSKQHEPEYDSDEPSVTSDFEPYKRNKTLKPDKNDQTPCNTNSNIRPTPKSNENIRVEELFNISQQNKTTTNKKSANINDEFITIERNQPRTIDESIDGAFISKEKTPEPTTETPTSPTFRKKGLSRRETFEERCRNILGMENYGDTQGTYKKHIDNTETDTETDEITKSSLDTAKDIKFVVKIEDCDDDDDKPLSINNIRETMDLKKKKTETVQVESKKTTTKATNEKVMPKRSSPEPQLRQKDQPKPVISKPSRYSPERPRSPEKTDSARKSPERKSSSKSPVRYQQPTQRPSSKQSSPDIEIEFEIVPKSKSPSPTRKSKSPSPTRKSSSPYVNESTTIELITKTNRRSKSPSPGPAPKSHQKVKPQSKKFDERIESELETESPLESDVDTIKENYITEKIITCKNDKRFEKTVLSPSSPKSKPKPKTSGQTETITTTSSTLTRKPSVPKSTDKTPKTPQTTQKYGERKLIDDNQTKSSRISTTTATNSSIKTTAKHTITPKQDLPASNRPISSPKQQPKPSKVNEPIEQTKTTNKKTNVESTESTIKNRLRSATRNTTKKSKVDQQDGALSSSPDSSPTRGTQRRRSSNISVHTEIIIEHAGSKSPEREMPVAKKPQSATKKPVKDIPDTILTRKLPVTERKESAPVNRVTRRDDDVRMSRSTSENIMKVNGHTKPLNRKPIEPSSLSPKTERRPNKCFTTKTINLTTTDKLINSEDMENVIIDIQHAKSSREPSPDKIVPTPVPAYLDTGKPRYPDVVQEPEDVPHRRPVVKNIPILEEDTNAYVGCHISEVKLDKTSTTTIDNIDYNEEILTQPTIEAPKSLDYPSIDKPDDECLLSVHEKVSKFVHTAEEVKKPKASSPFNPAYEKSPEIPEDDECLLTVDEKVNKFLKTAESITKAPISHPRDVERPNLEDLDEELRHDECTLSVSEKVNKFISTAEKLAPSSPQRSPELVAKIERHISRQSEPDDLYEDENENEDVDLDENEPSIPFSENHTVELEMKRQKDILSRPSVWGKDAPKEPLKKEPEVDTEELVPMSKTHTTDIEFRRQKDILSRPSVFEGKKSSPIKQPSPTPMKKSTILDKLQRFEGTTASEEQPKANDKPIKKTPDNKKPLLTSTSVLNTRARFESSNIRKETKNPTDKQRKPVVNGKVPSSTPNKPTNAEVVTTDETESEKEFIETEEAISRKNSTKSEKITQPHAKTSKTPKEVSHSPTRRSSSSSPNKSTTTSTTTTTTRVTERTSKLHPTTTTTDQTQETVLNESIIESSMKTPTSTHSTQPSKPRVITESVAARRNIFEKSPVATSPKIDARRPSYMDHTRSSLEHIRRDSLEVNKTHYSRKPSTDDDTQYPIRPNSAVTFDVPQKGRKHESISEDINIEEIFDLEVLEEMLETVTSYELRRRIRAQIRLVKKNALNMTSQTDSRMSTSSTSSTTHKSSMYTSNKSHHTHHHHTACDCKTDDKHVRKPSPSNRTQSPRGRPSKPETVDDTYRSEKPRDHSPMAKTVSSSLKEVRRTSDTEKHYSRLEQVDSAIDHKHTHVVRHSPERAQTPQQRHQSPSSKPPIKPRERSHSPEIMSKMPSERVSPIPKPRDRSLSPQQKSGSLSEERRTISTKTTSRTTYSPERKPSKSKVDDKAPIWADRKNILKTPSSQTSSPTPTRKTPSSSVSRSSATKVTKSTVSQRQTKTNEEDCITSSYGIGPTDENGLPLFGIRALKKKNSKPVEPCDDSEEVTGYVIEEQWYSDGTKVPKHERKEFIYSTNEKELESLKKQTESRKSSKDDVNVTRKYQKIDKDYVKKEPEAILFDSGDEYSKSKKYVRRGSVKEMSEKFVRKESTQSMNEKSTSKSKSSGYPKAGLIFRTNSRKGSMGADDAGNMAKTTTTTTRTTNVMTRQQPDENNDEYDNYESAHAHEDYDQEYQTSARSFHESESECESMSAKREFMSKKSASSMSSSTRSFLNTTGESRIVTDVDDVLERMRNADNVVEEGDTAEDQEARALLNKFLGASVIMRGVETGNLVGTPQGKQETKTTTNTTYNDGDKVTTTRVTKTIKTSGSSSTPVTYTTCDIEEIWDEEILKQLLERATTYEERRKIRARLRELMAEREEKTSSKTAGKVAEKVAEKTATTTEEVEESSESEYEEIIEEVTDYSDAEEEEQKVEQAKSTSDKSIKKSASNKSNESSKSVEKPTKEIGECPKKADKTECNAKVKTSVTQSEKAESNVKKEKGGESLLPFLQDLLHKSRVPAKKQASNCKQVANQNSKNTTKDIAKTISSSKQIHKTNTNKISGGGSVSACISSSDSTEPSKNSSENKTSSCTVLSVSNNKKSSGISSSSLPQKTITATTTTNKDMTNKLATTPSSGNDSKSERLSVPQREDSGIESGEDLRLIAAGLRDKLQMQNGDSNLIEEVTTALCKLECSLKEGKEIPLDGQKRKALLALVARLQAGLTSPEQLDDVNSLKQSNDPLDNDENNFDETSSPETDGHRTSRHRFAKRRNRNTRHTVGVSREELADARRYMEDMLMMESITNSTTPESSVTPAITPPQWFPIEKNASSSAILSTQPPPAQPLYRPNQFVPSNIKSSTECLNVESNPVVLRNGGIKNTANYRRPLSGEYSVSFEQPQRGFASDGAERSSGNVSPDSAAKGNRFNSKKVLMKRANTIDIPKSKKYNPEFDTDSELEDRGPHLGLKRTVQVSVKQKVRHVVPPFEPKTENDHKFLAFINKQSPKPGLGWTTSRSVSNWTNKFGNIKNTFEVGAAAMATTGKPPQVPGYHSSAANRKQNAPFQDYGQAANRSQQQWQIQQQQQQQQQKQQQQQQQQQEAVERQRMRMERDRLERERIEKDRLERQRFERERVERDRLDRERLEREKERLEREYFERERERVQRDRLAAAAAAQQQQQLMQLQQQQQQQQQKKLQQKQRQQQQQQPAPVNQFIHAPQSVFKPIENGNPPAHNVYKPIPQMPVKTAAAANTWQPPSSLQVKPNSKNSSISSPQFLNQNKSPYTTSPSSTATSPIGLPWVSKPAVNNTDFRNKANRFEEASQNDNREAALAAAGIRGVQRHNSLRSARVNPQQFDDFRKRPSLPNASDPYQTLQNQYVASNYDLPPPTNISFRYTDCNPRANSYKSVPCLPTAVDASMDGYLRSREDSLTNPQAVPLVLTSSNPSYGSHADSLQNSYMQTATRPFEYARPNVDSTPTSPATFAQTDCTDDDLDLDSDNNLLEYRVESKVMRKPQSQTAVTVGRRTAHVSDDEVYGKNSRAAKNLLHTMRSLGNEQRSKPNEMINVKKKPTTVITSPTSPGCLSPDGRSYQAPIVEPLFPDITSFAQNREPLYSGERAPKPLATSQKNSAYKQTQQMKIPQNPPPLAYEQQYVNQSNAYHATSVTESIPTSAPAPYISETQTAYVVTYPLDDPSDVEEHYQPKQHPTSLPLQRQRNISENSTSSSVSYSYNNLPSPNTNWTPNPVHAENQQDKVIAIGRKNSTHLDDGSQQLRQQKLAPPEAMPSIKILKPDVAPKPQTTVPSSYQELSQQYYQTQERTPKLSTRSQTISTTTSDQKWVYQQQQQNPTLLRQKTVDSSTSSSGVQQQQNPTLLRQKTVDSSTSSSGVTPLQTQNRVLSQQSLVTKQQQEFEKFEQKQQRNQQLIETRRKSLGHIQDIQELQHKTAYYESKQSEIIKREEYKSSAPADTPDIVKSSLPKDENTPILKKFGPPQRHHYIPNAYQTPSLSSQNRSESKKTTTGNTTKVFKREVVQHSLVTTKPSIVETPATPQPQDANSEDMIPRNIVFNNVNAFTSLSRRNHEQERTVEQTRFNRLSKCDSWNQICQIQQAPTASSPKFNTSGNDLRRTKSGHSLAVPKMYEAGINKAEITEKQRTVAAYFSGNRSPNASESTEIVVSKKSSINRIKTTEKVSANRKSLTSAGTAPMTGNGGLVRSATMPHIGNLNLLDESNVEDAFEQLMSAQQSQQQKQHGSSTTEKTETKEKDGAIVTTTTKVTTRTVTGGTSSKPASPFTKFKQLDRQNSQQSQKCPSTPTTPGCSSKPTTPGSAPLFKFTDPALNARAATVKDQLLQWCQSKTKEYENVQITNFSGSWTDGLAFCALIHHFLPDAFDYSKLTTQNRRHNFELAFTVADEKAGIAPLLDVEDMVVMKRPDWKCVFVYVQSIYCRFRNCQ